MGAPSPRGLSAPDQRLGVRSGQALALVFAARASRSAFRTAKSDLWLHPVFHHKTERVEAHILVCFLALALWRTLEMWMKGKGSGTCAWQLVAEVATIRSMDIVLPVRQSEQSIDLRLRTVAKPERLVAELLQRLDLQLPARSQMVENVVEKRTL